jgi:hypothetical protein
LLLNREKLAILNNRYFYHATLRRAISVFGTLFNNISIVRRDTNNSRILQQEQKVPLAYGPRESFLSRTDSQEDPVTGIPAIILPRMSFEMTSLSYDAETALPLLNKSNHSVQFRNNEDKFKESAKRTWNYAPYRLGINLSIMAKQTEDSFQILEQILPYFRPDFVVTIRQLNEDSPDSVWDMPITLTSVSPSISYEGDVSTNRVIIHSLDFELRVRMFGPVGSQGVIHKVIANFNDYETEDLLTRTTFEAIPLEERDENFENGFEVVETFLSNI